MKTMYSYFIGLMIFLLTDFVYAACPENEIYVCRDVLLKLKTDENMFHPVTEESLKEICRMEEAVIECIDDYASRCLTNSTLKIYHSLTDGSRSVFNRLCCEDSKLKAGYLKHATCLKQIREDIAHCIEKYEKSHHNISFDTLWDDVQKICCSYFERLDCATTVARQYCGEEAGRFMEDLLTEPEGTLLNTKCSGRKTACISSSNSHYSNSILSVISIALNILVISFPLGDIW